MKITRKSEFSGITRELDLPITEEQYKAWQDGMMIQEAMPHLTNDQREFLLSGMTKEEWDQAFPEDDEGIGDEEAYLEDQAHKEFDENQADEAFEEEMDNIIGDTDEEME